jgi:hypothetical protein
MATERQIESNRVNAGKSTGPRTVEGKSRSRGNAFKHGLAGDNIVADPATLEAIEERKEAWASGYLTSTPEGEWTYHQLVASSFQIDRAEASMDVHKREFAARAEHAWDEDHRLEAELVAAKMSRNPGLALRTLEASRHGAELLIDRWNRLGDALDTAGDWNEAERDRALDLLGIPADLRRGRTPVDFPEGADPIASRRAIVCRQVERLIMRKAESLEPLDEMHRAYAEATYGAELSKVGLQIWRYQREALNRFLKARRELRAPEGPRPAQAESTPAEVSPLERRVAEIIAARNAAYAAQPEPIPVARETDFAKITIAPKLTNPERPARPASSLNRRERRAAASQQRRG